MRPHFLALLGLSVIVLAGCNSQDASNLGKDTKQMASDAGHAFGGTALAAKVNTSLSLHKGIDMSGLHIEAQDSTVTVGGHVRDKHEHQVVISTVKDTTGVDHVIDKLKELKK